MVHALKNEGLTEEVEYRVQVRVNSFGEEMAKLLKAMNVTNTNFGFESGSQKVLNVIKKDVTVDRIKEAVVRGKRYGLAVTGSLMFGVPNETLEDMKLTLKLLDFMYQHGAAVVWFFVATPYPGTEFWRYAESKGKVSFDMDWDLLDLRDFSDPLLLDPSVSKKQFQKVIWEARRKVTAYFRLHAKNKPLSRQLKTAFKHPIFTLGVAYEMFKSKLNK